MGLSGDIDFDGSVSASDVQPFTECLAALTGPTPEQRTNSYGVCRPADMDASAGTTETGGSDYRVNLRDFAASQAAFE